jgi:hypothetical protein
VPFSLFFMDPFRCVVLARAGSDWWWYFGWMCCLLQLLCRGRAHHECAVRLQRSPEGFARYGFLDAFEGGMHPSTSTGKGGGVIHHYLAVSCDNPHQGGLVGAGSAAKAGSYGFHTNAGCPAQPSRMESGWMSMRAPVSFAASRAFWPSLPIASDSW